MEVNYKPYTSQLCYIVDVHGDQGIGVVPVSKEHEGKRVRVLVPMTCFPKPTCTWRKLGR